MLRLPPGAELGHVRDDRRDLGTRRIASLERRERALVRGQRRVVLAAEAADPRDQIERTDRFGRLAQLLVELQRLLSEMERLDVRVDRSRALRGLPRVLGRFLGYLAEQVVVRQGREEVAHRVAEDGLVRDRDPAMELDPTAHEQRVVGDLLDDRVLESVAALAALPRRSLQDEVGRDELIDRVGEARRTRLAEHAIAEALPDDRRELDALPCRRREPVDASRDDGVQRGGDLERRGALPELPFAFLILRDRARIDQ